MTAIPNKQIRAVFDDDTITVYQAYSSTIATAAVENQMLSASPAFKFNRMTWVKPSWCWMMYAAIKAICLLPDTHVLGIVVDIHTKTQAKSVF